MTMSTDYLEEEFKEPFTTWKANPTPQANTQILNTLQPVIEKGIRTHVGEPNPLLTSRARKLTLDGLASYDPKRSRLQTHLFNQYQGLKRINRQQNQVIAVPERVQFDSYQLQKHTQELADSLGRDPTDAELANHTGFSKRRMAHVRRFQLGIPEGQMESMAPGFAAGIQPDRKAQDLWVEMVYDDLPPIDQKIMEHALGLHGRPALSNMAIAKQLGRSPGAISQRKARIQAMLDKEQNLSPFLE